MYIPLPPCQPLILVHWCSSSDHQQRIISFDHFLKVVDVFVWSIPVIIFVNDMSPAMSPATAPAIPNRTSQPSALTPQEVSAHGQRVKGPIVARRPSYRRGLSRHKATSEVICFFLGGNGWNMKADTIFQGYSRLAGFSRNPLFFMWNDFR